MCNISRIVYIYIYIYIYTHPYAHINIYIHPCVHCIRRRYAHEIPIYAPDSNDATVVFADAAGRDEFGRALGVKGTAQVKCSASLHDQPGGVQQVQVTNGYNHGSY